MPHLLLIRHSLPEIVPSQPVATWSLSEEGRARCFPLAERVAAYSPDIIFTSLEPKAQQTGEILAGQLHLPWQTMPDLHEHDRTNTPFFATRAQFHAAVENFFNHPSQLVFGHETAQQTLTRFTQAIHRALAVHPNQTIAIVSHGTVISLFIAHFNRLNALEVWHKLHIPDLVILTRPDFCLHPSSQA